MLLISHACFLVAVKVRMRRCQWRHQREVVIDERLAASRVRTVLSDGEESHLSEACIDLLKEECSGMCETILTRALRKCSLRAHNRNFPSRIWVTRGEGRTGHPNPPSRTGIRDLLD